MKHNTGSYVIKGVDEVVVLLDDQIVKVQGMRGSPYARGERERLPKQTKADITEMKGMKSPPKLVKLVMEGVCIMLEVAPEKKASGNGKGKVDDYWGPATKIMSDVNFMNRLLDFDKDKIPAAVIKKIKTYVVMSCNVSWTLIQL